ncbi:MAG TPA: acyl-CoA dehydrogenase family protein [Blastocatellia bacterium]
MEFDLNETQKLFQRSARELFTQELPSVLARETTEKNTDFSAKIWRQLVSQGWTGLIFAEDQGGMGLGTVELAVAFEEMGRALVPGPFMSTVPLAGSLICRAAPGAVRDKYVKMISEGEAKATVAILEDSAAWEPAAIQLHAADDAGGVKLSGRKLFVTDANEADLIIVAARSANGLVLALVPSDSAGVSVSAMPSIDTLRPLYEVALTGVRVPADRILARGKQAEEALAHAIDVATIAVTAEMVGGMQWMLDATVEYAKTRKQFGKPIGQFQAIQHHCANMLLMTESSRSAVYYAAWAMDARPELAPLAVSVAKTYASDCYRESGNLGIQVHGGIGFTWDHEIHFYYKRAKASELLFGDATFHRERIAKRVIDHAGDQAEQPQKAAAESAD